jgi:hypothetical protein
MWIYMEKIQVNNWPLYQELYTGPLQTITCEENTQESSS